MRATLFWPEMIPPDVGEEETIHFRPPQRRYTPPSALMTLSRFAPMIDMSFLLLVFFVTTTRFERPEGTLASEMPRDAGLSAAASAVALPLTPVVVRISRDGMAHNDWAISVDRSSRAPTDMRELTRILRVIQQEPGFDGRTPVVIVAGDDVPWDHVVGCWNAALNAGCLHVAFGDG